MPSYIGLIHKEPDSDFGVSFPDFPGCVSAGSTLEEAQGMAREALIFHVEGLLEDGEALPRPSPLDEVMADSAHRDAVAILVPLPEDLARSVRVNITLPEPTLRRIDTFARAQGSSRSAFLAAAALKVISESRP
jgi:predicted RNase H-like HicB family nuclease